ncbi:MAG: hypothetical protein Q8J70_10740 [Thiobacillus sp.]|nr:hypothetical protein [Thiobacillus sp.]
MRQQCPSRHNAKQHADRKQNALQGFQGKMANGKFHIQFRALDQTLTQQAMDQQRRRSCQDNHTDFPPHQGVQHQGSPGAQQGLNFSR